ncbi:hypothetical protein JXA85_08205 [Candidatus Woesearchaeota archaeon]|nr:hypothetical protein [Candidatus Woesearchaeota archaeon]
MAKKKRQKKTKQKEPVGWALRDKYIKELASLDTNNPSIFSNLVKNFFKDAFRINYEVSFEELIDVAMRKKYPAQLLGEITKLLTELSEFEFKTESKNFDSSYFKYGFERVLHRLTSTKTNLSSSIITNKKHLNLSSLLKKLFTKRKQLELGQIADICKKHIDDKNLASAKDYYLLAIEKYNVAPHEEQEKHYESLRGIREKLLTAK